MTYCINRKGDRQEFDFPHDLGPKRGKCATCGEEIKPYSSYYMDRNTGDMYCCGKCSDWAIGMFLMEHGFHFYSDG